MLKEDSPKLVFKMKCSLTSSTLLISNLINLDCSRQSMLLMWNDIGVLLNFAIRFRFLWQRENTNL